MGRKKLKKPQLKWRVVKDIVVILGISLLISAIGGFFYFERIACEQKISDEKAKQQQLSNQLSFMTEDIQQYADSILVDEQLQELLEESAENEYEKRRKQDRISRRLMFYSNLRSYISSTILITEDGSCYESNYNRRGADGQGEEISEEIYDVHFESEDSVFSEYYRVKESEPEQKLICYRVPLLDKYEYGQQIGILYMEVYLDYFLEQVKLYGSGYENICLISSGQNFLYRKDTDGIIQKFMGQEHTLAEESASRIGEGYLISTEIQPSGWRLCTLLPRSQIWQSSRFVLNFFLVSFLFSIGMVIFFSSKIMERIVRPVVRLSEQMEEDDYGNLGAIEIVHTGDEIETLYRCYCAMIEKLREEEQVRAEQEKKKKEMEFAIMQSQIAPHYLYNVLNTVIFLAAAEKKKNIVELVRALIYTLQETLDLGDEQVETTVEKELRLVRAYLDIQKYRYRGKFQSEISCEEELENCIVPKTIIQPMVENALVHGILPSERVGTVTVQVCREGEKLVVKVADDGVGIEEERLREYETGAVKSAGTKKTKKREGRKQIGIENVRERIRYLYGEAYGLKIQKREGGGTEVLLYLPLRKGEHMQ